MPRLKQRDETYFTTVRGMCRRCRTVGPSRVFFRDGQVWQQSLCPCGPQEPALIAADSQWYLAEVVARHARSLAAGRSAAAAARLPARLRPLHLARLALPASRALDHQRLQPALPDLFHLQPRRPHLAHAGRGDAADGASGSSPPSGRVDLINITGGEPTLHPDLLEILASAAARRSAGSR